MFKFLGVILLATIVMIGAIGSPTHRVQAQEDATPLTLGEWTEGEITADTPEVNFTFEATEGMLVLIEMYPALGDSKVNPEFTLLKANGSILGEVQGFSGARFPFAVPKDGTYTITAFSTFSSDEGAFAIRVRPLELFEAGSEGTVTLVDDFKEGATLDDTLGGVYVIRPEEDGAWNFTFTAEEGTLSPNIKFEAMTEDLTGEMSGDTLFDINLNSALTASISINLVADTLYVITVDNSVSFGESEDQLVHLSAELAE
jgi:hypothetical protein